MQPQSLVALRRGWQSRQLSCRQIGSGRSWTLTARRAWTAALRSRKVSPGLCTAAVADPQRLTGPRCLAGPTVCILNVTGADDVAGRQGGSMDGVYKAFSCMDGHAAFYRLDSPEDGGYSAFSPLNALELHQLCA